MKRLLVPIDLRVESYHHLDYAAGIAKSGGYDVTILYVHELIPLAVEGTVAVGAVNEEAQRIHATQVVQIGREYRTKHPDIDVSTEVVIGHPGSDILRLSDDYDMIIMGSRRDVSPVIKWLGSVSKYVVLNAECPVLVVPSDVESRPMRSVLFGFSEQQSSEHHIRAVLELSSALNCKLHIGHISTGQYDETLIELEQRLTKEYPDRDIDYVSYVANAIDQGLIDLTHRVGADVLCVAKTNKSIWRYFVEGNHTEHLLKMTDVPLLVINRIEE